MRRWLCSLALGLCLGLTAAGTESVTYATAPGGVPGLDAVAALSELTGQGHAVDVDLLVAGVGQQPVSMHLVNASAAGIRQALAAALGCWWVRLPEQSDSYRYTRSAQLPLGALSVHWNTSALVGKAHSEALVRALMAPWVSGQAGIAFQVEDGTWPACLDATGQVRLVEVLSNLERPTAHCPNLVPDPDAPDLTRVLSEPVHGGTWDELVHSLARVASVSVVLGADLAPSGRAPDDLPLGTLSQVLEHLTASGVSATIRHGVVCITRTGTGDQEHPAQRRRLALIPVIHLVHSQAEGELLALALTRAVQPEAWSLPGWGLYYENGAAALLVAADPPVIYRVLDALDVCDALGFDQGIASLTALQSAGP